MIANQKNSNKVDNSNTISNSNTNTNKSNISNSNTNTNKSNISNSNTNKSNISNTNTNKSNISNTNTNTNKSKISNSNTSNTKATKATKVNKSNTKATKATKVNKSNKDKKYKKFSLILGILIFVLISVFIVIIIVSWYTTNPEPITFVNTKNGEFLFTCSEYECDDGYICDSNYLICKKNFGSDCNNYLECANDLFCSGICATGPTGSLDAFCPCIPNVTTCVNVDSITNKRLCRLISGSKCTSDDQCASNNCNNQPGLAGKCLAGFNNSAPCKLPNECASNNCVIKVGETSGFCQNTGSTPFTIGSACQGNCYDGIKGSDCNLPLTCQCGGITGSGPGICKNLNLGLSVNCSNLEICTDELVCINSTGSNSTCNGDFITDNECSCIFNYFDPNIPINNICITGMTDNNGTCTNSLNLGCNNLTDMCKSKSPNSCNMSIPVLATYRFSDNSGDNFINSTNTSINAIPITQNSFYNFDPITIFCTSNNNVDTIFLVDKNNGLLYLVNDINNINEPRTWNQILPSTTVNPTGQDRILKYVAFNGIFWILLFNEISLPPTNDIYTSVYWTKSKTENATNIPDIGIMTYFQLGTITSYPGQIFYKFETTVTPFNGDYIDIAPLNFFSKVQAYTDIYTNYLLITIYIEFVNKYVPFLYDINFDVNYFIYYGIRLSNKTPVKYYYDQDIKDETSPSQICEYNTTLFCDYPYISPTGGNNCQSYNNFSFVELNPNIKNNTINANFLQFFGNFAGNNYPVIGNAETIYYDVYDYSIYSPGATGLYTYSKDTNICNLGIVNANIIMLCESYSNTTQPTKLGNVVVVVNKQTTAILPYIIDPSFKCAASDNAFYIISPGSCS